MREYERLGHMGEVIVPSDMFFAIIPESSETTKFRNVFVVSAKTSCPLITYGTLVLSFVMTCSRCR